MKGRRRASSGPSLAESPSRYRARGAAWPFDGGRSAVDILSEAVAGDRDQPEPNLAEAIRRRFAPLGGVDLELPPAEFVDAPPSFDP